jgi:effector-binding domain-containing protein
LRPDATVSGREGVEIRLLPAARVAQVLHRGSYDDLHWSYRKIFDFLAANGAVAVVPSREIYLKGPGMILPRSPKRFLTLIQVPATPQA